MVHSRLSSSANTVSDSSNVHDRDSDVTYLFKTWKDEEEINWKIDNFAVR